MRSVHSPAWAAPCAALLASQILMQPRLLSPNTPKNSLSGRPVVGVERYITDAVAARAEQQLRDAVKWGRPFFLYLTPIAPHVGTDKEGNWVPPTPAARHAELYPGVKLPYSASMKLPNPNILLPTDVSQG